MSERAGRNGGGAVLELHDLSVRIPVSGGRWVEAVGGVTLTVGSAEIVGLVGESGCGKSTLGGAIMGLLPGGSRVAGEVLLRGQDLRGLAEEDYRRIRGDDIALVSQDPSASLDPTFPVGAQVAEAIRNHRDVSRRAARERAVELLRVVGIPDPGARYADPPHRFSGGMKQRVVIAAALANDPAVLIADEPTTALDVTIQAQILHLLRDLTVRSGTGVLLITHDLGVVAQVCDRVAVMYAGQVVEQGTVREVFAHPSHPYTRALLESQPAAHHRSGDLPVIPGRVPDLSEPPAGCRFAARCPRAHDRCAAPPPEIRTAGGGRVSCWLHHDTAREAR
ncbi:ABC transporter ATP-binding protein [Microbispora sp. RL4-1S]|uniref:Nickel import system ATP-binding protein NikD n=1 Tax=Microbispora oryzae TaxID=2806554 RepID=A0A941AL29_9ACTN|nr:ABC transporter ATP-binding protein [Microbispora oryzae]MBP2707741.1 ABC transporter ATP-binding protein [Microbispora oryzae]